MLLSLPQFGPERFLRGKNHYSRKVGRDLGYLILLLANWLEAVTLQRRLYDPSIDWLAILELEGREEQEVKCGR